MIVKHFSAVVVVFALTACCTQPKGKTQSEESDEKRLSTSVELIYVPEAGKTCSPSPGSQDGCVRQISSFQKKYWRLELDSVGSTGYVPRPYGRPHGPVFIRTRPSSPPRFMSAAPTLHLKSP